VAQWRLNDTLLLLRTGSPACYVMASLDFSRKRTVGPRLLRLPAVGQALVDWLVATMRPYQPFIFASPDIRGRGDGAVICCAPWRSV
jgi:hypothetical protein